MNTEQTMCALLRQSLFGIPFQPPLDTDWQALLNEAKQQMVVGLIKGNWETESAKILANSMRILHAENELVRLLQAQEIPLAILKGTAAAVYYPKPMLRTMGDIDFIVPQEHFDAAAELLDNNGYKLTQPLSPESPRHTGYLKNGIEFELHHHFSCPDLDIEEYIIDGLNRTETVAIGDRYFPILPSLANGLVILAHIRSHLKGGLGLRQVIDWMMYVDKVLGDEFWKNEFEPVAVSKGLDSLAITLTRMCQIYLGLSDRITWCNGADPVRCESLMSLIFSFGNFGRKKGRANELEMVSVSIRNVGLFRYLQTAGEHNWTVYKKYPQLKPLCWAYQLCRIAWRGTRSKRGLQAFQDIDHSKERYELLKDLGVI